MADPKGYLVGFGESASTSVLAGQAMRGRRTTKRRTKRKAKTQRRTTKRRAKTTRGGRLKKGSAAAKRRMSQLRKMRRK